METRKGEVRLAGEPVGIVEELDDDVRFTYLSQWLQRSDAVPISVTMPLRPEPYVSKGLHPFFENLLPEGWLLEISSKTLKVSKEDAFGLLLATCGDCVGAVEVIPAESGDR
ncbi:MAG: HipA N-terminal domain-containing protein [Candidatus Nealsonbacteria bacterium]|nr:HipA N-terminal domain-containing protein [Candidatus Nealsonbacteria bacterium]